MKKTAVVVGFLSALVYYLLFAPPNKYLIDIEPITYSTKLIESFDGPLQLNNILSSAEHLLVNNIHGPESLVYKNGNLYTTTFGGMVVRIGDSKVVPVAKIGDSKCDEPWKTEECGTRPLGLRLNSKGRLYVVDAYKGLCAIDNIDTTTPQALGLLPLSATRSLTGGESKFFDDITIAEGAGKRGGDVVYISDVSTKWDLSNFPYGLIEHDITGRILRFDTDSYELSVVDDGFVFPNGVQITDDADAILICELGKQRILRTFISGPRYGESEVFANLPGECDNVRRSANPTVESYWVAFAMARNSSNPLLLDRLGESPLIRKFLGRFLHLFGVIIETIGELVYSESLKAIGYSFKKGMPLLMLDQCYGMIAEYDIDGNVLSAYYSLTGETSHLSEVLEVEGDNGDRILYLGSYSNSYLGRLVIKKKFSL